MLLAKKYKCESIAFPLIGTGNYGFPKVLALQTAVREISSVILKNEMQIYLVVFGNEEVEISEKLFKSVSSYIDKNYLQNIEEYIKVRSMIEYRKKKYGWEFLFPGANIDAAKEAERFGIAESMSADYHCDGRGTALNYEVLNKAITSVRGCSKPLSADWKKKIEEDYKGREEGRFL